MTYIPYETLSQAEAEDITAPVPTSLIELSLEQPVAVKELITDGVARGMDKAFAISEFSGQDPATLMGIHNAGIAEGERLQRGGISEQES